MPWGLETLSHSVLKIVSDISTAIFSPLWLRNYTWKSLKFYLQNDKHVHLHFYLYHVLRSRRSLLWWLWILFKQILTWRGIFSDMPVPTYVQEFPEKSEFQEGHNFKLFFYPHIFLYSSLSWKLHWLSGGVGKM